MAFCLRFLQGSNGALIFSCFILKFTVKSICGKKGTKSIVHPLPLGKAIAQYIALLWKWLCRFIQRYKLGSNYHEMRKLIQKIAHRSSCSWPSVWALGRGARLKNSRQSLQLFLMSSDLFAGDFERHFSFFGDPHSST